MSTTSVVSARREWEEGHRRFETAVRDPASQEPLLAQFEAVTDELRRRVGQTFTLQELTAVYAGAERWVRTAIEEHAASPGWPRNAAMIEDAAFHVYARGAVDYSP